MVEVALLVEYSGQLSRRSWLPIRRKPASPATIELAIARSVSSPFGSSRSKPATEKMITGGVCHPATIRKYSCRSLSQWRVTHIARPRRVPPACWQPPGELLRPQEVRPSLGIEVPHVERHGDVDQLKPNVDCASCIACIVFPNSGTSSTSHATTFTARFGSVGPTCALATSGLRWARQAERGIPCARTESPSQSSVLPAIG